MRTKVVLWRAFAVYGIILFLASLALLFSPMTAWSLTPKPIESESSTYYSNLKQANLNITAFTITVSLNSGESIAVGSHILTRVVVNTSQAYTANVAAWSNVSIAFADRNLYLQFDGKQWMGEASAVYSKAGAWTGNISVEGTAANALGGGKYAFQGAVTVGDYLAQTAIPRDEVAWALSLPFWLGAIAFWFIFHNRVRTRAIHARTR